MKKRTTKMIGSIMIAIVLIVLSACGSSGSGNTTQGSGGSAPASNESNKPKLGIAVIDLKNAFFVRMKEGGDAAAKDYGVEAIWQSADGSLEKQISIIENFIQQKVDVILIDPMDAKGLIPVIDKAGEAGIPVITMGNKVEGKQNHNTLYPDYENMGMIARAMATAMDGKGQIALLTGAAGNFVSDTREKGFKDVIEKEFPDVEIVGVQPTSFDPAQAQRITETWLNNYPDLKGIAVITDPLALGAMSAAEAKGKQLIYGGIDGDVEMHPFFENGSMIIDVLTGSARVGYWNVAAGARIAKGSKFPTDLFMPTHFIMTDDMALNLKSKGMEFRHITPQTATVIATGYTEELGPNQPDERISGQ
ncbi:hypothetical protein PAE9249_01433 [Paenibacillus sp. CECT 9249]|uniref:sugar ABC transporter substrate-binding protein n=1 Tax=Paenibacillus sp. CECT 9249 TaxID=2845385 RepID=UPI001E3D8BB5|nr:sugar ABC transporter substrate-binding protein [Paenibacillus sp. CECT 9249]CAH0118936.1 hypothetical protein PAE9249_01433 [Paenibacillus sp. CECT 9249]